MMEQAPEFFHPERYIVNPVEDLDAEYKGWLDRRNESDRANLVKAVIALANHGGGVVVLGFEELSTGLLAVPKPAGIPDLTQDDVNDAVRRYAEPHFHCRLHAVKHPDVGSVHPVIRVPGGDVPVLSKRDRQEAGLGQYKVYVRKPGPRSEEPQTAGEWRTLLDRCVRARREDMLDSIRGIVLGRVDESDPGHTVVEPESFMNSSRQRWMELVQSGPEDDLNRFPDGHYEVAISLVNAQPVVRLPELKDRLAVAQSVRTSGWPPFLDIGVEGLSSYVHEGCIEAWLGFRSPRNIYSGPRHADFWRASPSGQLYLIRGYGEDDVSGGGSLQRDPGTILAIDITVIRVWECLRFASQFMSTFGGVESVVVRCQYTGLSGRSLIDSLDPVLSIRGGVGVGRTGEVLLTGQFTLQQLGDNMPEVLHHLLAPLFEHFDFFRLTLDHVQNIIDRYRQQWPW